MVFGTAFRLHAILFRGGGAAKKAVELTINNCNSLDNVDGDSSRGSSNKSNGSSVKCNLMVTSTPSQKGAAKFSLSNKVTAECNFCKDKANVEQLS